MKIKIISAKQRERQSKTIQLQLIVQAQYYGKQRERTTNEMEIGICLMQFMLQERLIKSKTFYARNLQDVVLYNYYNSAETYFKIEPIRLINHSRINPENGNPENCG